MNANKKSPRRKSVIQHSYCVYDLNIRLVCNFYSAFVELSSLLRRHIVLKGVQFLILFILINLMVINCL